MPGTINGIGTAYYGKRNVEKRPAVCEHCGKPGELATYETRLWFVVLFIPILPLGRKKVIDHCPNCNWHYPMSLAEWARRGKEAVREGVAAASKDPDNPKASVELLATLDAFRRRDEAETLAATMDERFHDRAEVQFALGGYYEHAGNAEKADACFERARSLEPENPAYRRAVAIACIQRGDLARARELLSFMEEDGASRDPEVLALLARACHDGGSHEDAVAVSRTVLAAAPALARDRRFRKMVRASEQAIGSRESILPGKPLIPRKVVAIAAVLVLAAGAVFGVSYYIGRSQSLYVVNALPVPATVRIDDGAAETIRPNSHRALTVGEGRHVAEVTAGDTLDETVPFTMSNGFFERFRGDSVFVLNVGGAATLIHQEVFYAAAPRKAREPSYTLHCVDRFMTFRDIDYPFEEAPSEITSEATRGRITKVSVEVVEGDPVDIVPELLEGSRSKAMEYAECWLAAQPDDEEMLSTYTEVAEEPAEVARCQAFLKKGLTRRPVCVEWHRTYQQFMKWGGAEAGLLSEYDGMLAKEPDDAALLYLRGRIEPARDAARAYFERARKADPKNPYPPFALGFDHFVRGDFAAAKTFYAEVVRLKPDSVSMRDRLAGARFALGEYAGLQAELAPLRRKEPLLLAHQLRWLHVLAAQGKLAEAAAAHKRYARALKAESSPDAEQAILVSRIWLCYFQGKPAEMLKAAERITTPNERAWYCFHAQIEAGAPDRAEKNLQASPGIRDQADIQLLLALAWRQKGDAKRAARSLEKAREILAEGASEERAAERLLRAGDTIKLKDVDDLPAQPWWKAILLCLLAADAPAQRQELLARAAKLDFEFDPPHRFIERVVAAMKTAD